MDVPGNAADSLEVVFQPGVRYGWAVQVFVFGPEGLPVDDVAHHHVCDVLDVERIIAARVESHGDEVARIVHTFGGRDIHLRAGLRIQYRWHLMVSDWRCLDCGVDTDAIGEYYMVLDEIWAQAHPTIDGQLCLECLETRLGRPLSASDFTDRPVNTNPHTDARRSPRLLALLGHDAHGAGG